MRNPQAGDELCRTLKAVINGKVENDSQQKLKRFMGANKYSDMYNECAQ